MRLCSLFLVAACFVAACSAPTVGLDGGDAATGDAGCPPAMPSGEACSAAPTVTCTYGPVCEACFAFTYTLETPTCSCNAGHWVCSHVDCGSRACRPGIYDDSMCTMPCAVPDAGSTDAASGDA